MTKGYITSSHEDVRRGLGHRSHSESTIGRSEFETKKIFDSFDPETKGRPVKMNQWSNDQDGNKQMGQEIKDDNREKNPSEQKSGNNRKMMNQQGDGYDKD